MHVKSFFLILIILYTTSCGSRKKLVYFHETKSDNIESQNYVPTLKPDDLLSIKVSADNPEMALPFNLIESTVATQTNNGYSTGAPERSGYLIDDSGMVNLPILGTIKLAGFKRNEAIRMLQDTLSAFIKNPIVNIQILNYKVTVLGDVNNPGTFKIPNERLTILEAIGLAGDIKITGRRINVLVIRDVNGNKEQYRLNLTKTDEVFLSPAYYLQQNDVVYVEPNFNQRTMSSFWRNSASIFISTAGVIISTISVITK